MRPGLPIALAAALALAAASSCGSAGAGADAGAGSGPGDEDGGAGDAPGGGDGEDGPKGDGKPGGPPAAGDNHAPELAAIGDRVVAVGEPLVIEVEGLDPDGDELTYGVHGAVPAEAKFSKEDHRFEWTPGEAGKSLFLTFVVTDGELFDRETIRIDVVAEKGQNAPSFVVVGDQVLVAGEPFELALSATDPDGDALTFGHKGPLPPGATLDAATGLFAWTPGPSAAGTTEDLLFTVTDGALSGQMSVHLVVKGAGGGGPSPPAFVDPGPQKATAGKPFSLDLEASDEDGDAVTIALWGGAPEGAKLAGAVFTWTPPADAAGQGWKVTFSAQDGTFTSYLTVSVTVVADPATIEGCTDDPGEDNGSLGTATPIGAGAFDASICDTDLVPLDVDVYAIEVPGGDELSVEIAFDPLQGDLDLFLVDGSEDVLAASATVSAAETVTYAPAKDETVFAVVVGVAQESFHMGYTMEVAFGEPVACTDDALEENDDFGSAKPLPGPGTTLALCPGDPDHYTTKLTCGQAFSLTLDTGGSGDLDVGLWLDTAAPPLAVAATADPVETLLLEAAPKSGTWSIRVQGYPPATGSGTYTLASAVSGGCDDDVVAGHSTSSAAPLFGPAGTLTGLKVCCEVDWISISLDPGEVVTVSVSLAPGAAGAAGLTAFAPDGTTQLDAAPPAAFGAAVSFIGQSGQAAAKHFLRVDGQIGTVYSVEWSVEDAPPGGGCTPLSCPKYEVCDAATGECMSDFCANDGDCPGDLLCRDTYCVDPCSGDSDCRTALGYVCKAFDAGTYCGIAGPGKAGAACAAHTSCAGAAVCTFQEKAGYCAELGCLANSDCPSGTDCVDHPGGGAEGGSLCAVWCFEDADCRTDQGYTCNEELVCLPI